MTALVTSALKRHDRRALVCRASLALLAAAILPIAGVGILAPWADLAAVYGPAAYGAPHRWHAAQWGVYNTLLVAGSLAGLAWRPRRYSLLAQYLLLLLGAGLACVAPFAPAALPLLLAPALVALAAARRPRGLLIIRGSGRPSLALLALSLLAAALLAADARMNLLRQIAGADVHAAAGHWGHALQLEIGLVLAGLLAATRRPGALLLAALAGAALIYLGLAAALLAGQPGGWGAATSLLATAIGWAFVGAAYWESRRARSSV